MSVMSLLRLTGLHGIFLLACFGGILQVKSQSQFYEEEYWNNVPKSLMSDPITTIAALAVAQVAPATEFDLIPALGWLQPPGTPQYKIKRCKRANVMNCTRGEYPR